MIKSFKPAIAAGFALLLAGSLAAPAQAQYQGFALANPTLVLAQSKTRDTAFQQVSQTFQTQIQLLGTLDNEITQLQTQLDTDGNKNISQAEIDAKPDIVKQIQSKQQQVDLATQPIAMAHYYILEQLINDYPNAQSQVVSDKGISVILSPDAVLYAPEAMDVTSAIATVLDTRVPSVNTAVPAGWQPRQATVQTYEQLQQVLIMAYQVQAARARQQQEGATTPAGPAASGR